MTEGSKNTASTIILSVIMAGAFFGVVIALSLDNPDDRRPEQQVELSKRLKKQSEPVELEVTVRVDRSERALREYRYQEDRDIVPEVVDEDLLQEIAGEPEEDAGISETPAENQVSEKIIVEIVPDLAEEGAEEAEIPRKPSVPIPDSADLNPEVSLSEAQVIPVEEEPADVPEWQKQAMAVPDLVNERRPLLSIVIDDVGIDQKRSAKSIELEGPLTFAFIPYGRNLQKFADNARSRGHEIMLHLPMEPQNPAVDPGPNAMLTVLEQKELRKRLLWNLEQFDGYVGLNNHMGSKFTAWEPGMAMVLEELLKRRIFFMDSVTSPKTVGFKLAREMGVDVAVRDVFLDHDQEIPAIQKQLKRLEEIALKKGHAIAIGHPHDNTTAALSEWLENVEERGFRLVPVSGIIYRNMQLKLSQKRS